MGRRKSVVCTREGIGAGTSQRSYFIVAVPPFFYYRYSVVSNAVVSCVVVSYVIVMSAFFLGLYFGFIFDFILVLFLDLSPLYRHFVVSVFLPGLDHIGRIKEIVPGIAGDDLFRFLIFYCRCCSGISRLFTLRGFLFFSESYGVQVLRPTTNFSWCFCVFETFLAADARVVPIVSAFTIWSF